MSRRFFSVVLTGLLAAGLGTAGILSTQAVAADTTICEQYGSVAIQGGRYIAANNAWGTSARQCINVTDTGFTVTQADGTTSTSGAPKSYPSVIYGCHWGNCSTSGNVLSPNGLRADAAAFDSIRTSVSMSYPSSGVWDAAYDIWFNKTQPTTATGQNDGAEVMVWLNHQGSIQPIGSKVGTATLAGATWDVWFGTSGWNVISYVRQSATASMDFSVSTFWDDVVSRGYGSTSWYLTSIQAGFEPWESGVGLAVNNFSVTTDGTAATATPTTDPTVTPTTPATSASGGCSAAYTTVNSWPGGFQGTVTVSNSASAAISGWTVGWAFADGQTISSLSNGTVTQSGSNVTVTNANYNGAIAAGGSTAFGFGGTGTAPNSLALTCTGA